MNQNETQNETQNQTAPLAQGWGLHPIPGVAYHWSARAIYESTNGAPSIDLVWDRMGIEGDVSDEDRAILGAWLDKHALPYLRTRFSSHDAPLCDEDEEIRISGDGFTLRANPRASYGYLYLSAAPDASATEPTPRMGPVNDSRTQCKHCAAYPTKRHASTCASAARVEKRQAKEGGPRDPNRRVRSRKAALVAKARNSYTIGRGW